MKEKYIVKIISPPHFETLRLCKKILTIRCRDDTFIIFDAAKSTNQPTNQPTRPFYILYLNILFLNKKETDYSCTGKCATISNF